MLDASGIVLVLGTHLLQGLTLVHLLDGLLEVLQAEDEHRDVIQRAACCTFSQDDLDTFRRSNVLIVVELRLGAATVHFSLGTALRRVVRREVIGRLRSYLLFDSAPDGVHALLVVKSFENSIAPDHEEIEVIFQFETANLWVADNHVCIATVLLLLGLDVTKGS